MNWRKIVTCCYPMYIIALVTLLPIMAIVYFFEEGKYLEASYRKYKECRQEFWKKR